MPKGDSDNRTQQQIEAMKALADTLKPNLREALLKIITAAEAGELFSEDREQSHSAMTNVLKLAHSMGEPEPLDDEQKAKADKLLNSIDSQQDFLEHMYAAASSMHKSMHEAHAALQLLNHAAEQLQSHEGGDVLDDPDCVKSFQGSVRGLLMEMDKVNDHACRFYKIVQLTESLSELTNPGADKLAPVKLPGIAPLHEFGKAAGVGAAGQADNAKDADWKKFLRNIGMSDVLHDYNPKKAGSA